MNLKEKFKIFFKNNLNIKNPINYLYEYKIKKRFENEKKLYKESYSAEDLLNKLINCGLKKGDTLFIHSSWNNFYNYSETPKKLIEVLLDYLGPEGTLAMPCFPSDQNVNKIFDVKRNPSGAGFLTEIFRRYKGVKRSININHSVCAYGKNAEYLVKDHHLSLTSWDDKSPYYRLLEVDALIVGLGVGHNLEVATCLHCVESILRNEIYYFSLIFPIKVSYKYKDFDDKIGEHTFFKRVGTIDTKKISKYFTSDELIEFKISNLDVYSIRAKILVNKTLNLANKGITMYTKPKPKKKLFYKIGL